MTNTKHFCSYYIMTAANFDAFFQPISNSPTKRSHGEGRAVKPEFDSELRHWTSVTLSNGIVPDRQFVKLFRRKSVIFLSPTFSSFTNWTLLLLWCKQQRNIKSLCSVFLRPPIKARNKYGHFVLTITVVKYFEFDISKNAKVLTLQWKKPSEEKSQDNSRYSHLKMLSEAESPSTS